MKIFLLILVVLPFLPAFLLAPDVTYPSQSVTAPIGEIIIKNSVLSLNDEDNIRHQIDVTFLYKGLSDQSCSLRPTYLKVYSSGNELMPSIFKMWTEEDARFSSENKIMLVTANYESVEVPELVLNLGITSNADCGMEFDENIEVELTKKIKRWWPWNVVSDLIHSV